MSYRKCLILFISFNAVILLSIPLVFATPVIGIGSMYDVLSPGKQSLTKRIYNTGDSTAFVRVELLEIHPEGDKRKNEVQQKELSGEDLEQNRLIVTPLRLIIPPSGFQSIRILWSGERYNERYFRVRFTPVMPGNDDSFGLDKKNMSEYREKALRAGVNVLTGYGTIVIVQPERPTFKTRIDDTNPEFVTVRNNGNTTVSLDKIRLCKSANTDCGNVTREFILPGRTYVLQRKTGYKTNFTLIEGNNTKVLSY